MATYKRNKMTSEEFWKMALEAVKEILLEDKKPQKFTIKSGECAIVGKKYNSDAVASGRQSYP